MAPINRIIKTGGRAHAQTGSFAWVECRLRALARLPPFWDYRRGTLLDEHVHLNFDGNYRLARIFAEQVAAQLPAAVTNHSQAGWSCGAGFARGGWRVALGSLPRLWQANFSRVSEPRSRAAQRCSARQNVSG